MKSAPFKLVLVFIYFFGWLGVKCCRFKLFFFSLKNLLFYSTILFQLLLFYVFHICIRFSSCCKGHSSLKMDPLGSKNKPKRQSKPDILKQIKLKLVSSDEMLVCKLPMNTSSCNNLGEEFKTPWSPLCLLYARYLCKCTFIHIRFSHCVDYLLCSLMLMPLLMR